MGLKPGPELDKMVAKALGWRNITNDHTIHRRCLGDKRWWGIPPRKNTHQQQHHLIRPFSTDPGEAIKALEEFCSHLPTPTEWTIEGFIDSEVYYQCQIDSKKRWFGEAYSLPHAICLAIVEAAKEKP